MLFDVFCCVFFGFYKFFIVFARFSEFSNAPTPGLGYQTNSLEIKEKPRKNKDALLLPELFLISFVVFLITPDSLWPVFLSSRGLI